MKNAARVVLAIVVVLAATLVLPRPASRVVAPDAAAQVPTPIPTIKVEITPDPDPTDEDDDDDGGGGGGGTSGSGGGGGGSTGSGGGGGGDEGGKNRKAGERDRKRGRDKLGAAKRAKKCKKAANKNKKKCKKKKGKGKGGDAVPPIFTDVPRIPGSYTTDELVGVAARLRSLGMPQEEVIDRVYPPFIIAGQASWIDTWHAPRYGPAPGQIRVHEGQDVFCEYGDPVLAPQDGIVDFSDGGLGGITARVHTSDGRYWYMTHLSDVNTRQFSVGDRVKTGDIVGYCGNSGNAATTAPHVHFGWYKEGGVKPKNPMRPLINWLRQAERRVLGVVTKTEKKRVRQKDRLTFQRRFGDAFVPDRTELRVAGESLWASGSNPASGTFTLAKAALTSALANEGMEREYRTLPATATTGAVTTGVDLDSQLAELLGITTHQTHDHD